jgi:hypothetical protein
MFVTASSIAVKGSTMSIWWFIAALAGALLVGYVLGAGAAYGGARGRGRSADGKPWWYDVAFPRPDEATLGALKVLADRYALGEIDADEYHQRVEALQAAVTAGADSEPPSKRQRQRQS